MRAQNNLRLVLSDTHFLLQFARSNTPRVGGTKDFISQLRVVEICDVGQTRIRHDNLSASKLCISSAGLHIRQVGVGRQLTMPVLVGAAMILSSTSKSHAFVSQISRSRDCISQNEAKPGGWRNGFRVENTKG
ncbi:uncharacterized protein MYCFIDRAFT_171636 [Pseudocercospora fijiensis CIRAD86]|uniref:Uncharacterized protein n=1 Tax=Pseudocercospora fijiensis (strain CIRAD86) TaxID=383855 RepID=M2Z7P1_PSEFD|nr:uncharacterized protein MYCFIDRAFT_171636 [Pseudocercospora fijiensis CIRAD86]EME85760.1 hypothetical protein MYCFIDRAFT_171636 [Pseudocercospora fijiensis CIRAD86]